MWHLPSSTFFSFSQSNVPQRSPTFIRHANHWIMVCKRLLSMGNPFEWIPDWCRVSIFYEIPWGMPNWISKLRCQIPFCRSIVSILPSLQNSTPTSFEWSILPLLFLPTQSFTNPFTVRNWLNPAGHWPLVVAWRRMQPRNGWPHPFCPTAIFRCIDKRWVYKRTVQMQWKHRVHPPSIQREFWGGIRNANFLHPPLPPN